VIVLYRRNESSAAVALSPRWASIARHARRIQREGQDSTGCAGGVVFTPDAAQRARLHPDCLESKWDLYMVSQ